VTGGAGDDPFTTVDGELLTRVKRGLMNRFGAKPGGGG